MTKVRTKITSGITGNFLIIVIILIGLILRLLLSQLPGFKFDVDTWFAWAQRLNEIGLNNFYSDQVWTNYTPGYLYILYILGLIKNQFSLDPSQFYMLLKIPSIMAEIILGVLVFKILSKNSLKWAFVALSLIVLNPAFIFNSSVWGQVDGFFSLVLFLCIFYLDKNIIKSSFFWGLGFLIKPQAIFLLPVLFIYLLKNFSIKNLLKVTLVITLTIFLFSLPFFKNLPINGIITLFGKMFSDYPYNSLFAYNFWGIFGFWIPDNFFKYWGYFLLVIYWLIISYFYFKRKISIFSLATLAALGFFFIPTRIHERYLYPGLFFLIFTATIYKDKLLLKCSLILSTLHFLNLYYVYIYYNEIYLKLPRLLYNPILYNLLDTNGKILSLLSTIIFILISIRFLKIDYAKKA